MFLTRRQPEKKKKKRTVGSPQDKNVINARTTFHYAIRNLQIKTIQPTNHGFKKAWFQKP